MPLKVGNKIDYYKSRGDIDLSTVPNRRQQRNEAAKLAVAKRRAQANNEDSPKTTGGGNSPLRTSSTSSSRSKHGGHNGGSSRELSPCPTPRTRTLSPVPGRHGSRIAGQSPPTTRQGSKRNLLQKQDSVRSVGSAKSTGSAARSPRKTKPPKGSKFACRPNEDNTMDGIFLEKNKDQNSRPKLTIQLSFRKNKSSIECVETNSPICNAA